MSKTAHKPVMVAIGDGGGCDDDGDGDYGGDGGVMTMMVVMTRMVVMIVYTSICMRVILAVAMLTFSVSFQSYV
eukprot:8738879-Pyramimonas_sp.AAC.1